jgi:iron(III) transport system substrate-binding protein
MNPSVIANVVVAALLAGCGQGASPPEDAPEPTQNARQESESPRGPLLVYASHDAARAASVLDAYRSETGTKFKLRSGAMPEQTAQGKNPRWLPKTDLFIAGSLAEVWAVAEADGLRPVNSGILSSNIPTAMRDAESRWVALSMRARIIVYNSELVAKEKIAAVRDYSDLGDDSWRGSLCLASSSVPGNQTLIAFLIKQLGVRQAEITVRKWQENLVALVFADDRSLLDAIASGQCPVGILDSNVFASFRNSRPDAKVAANWFAEKGNIAVDISGAGVSRHATDPAGATLLLEWLTTATPNALFATGSFDLPANSAAPVGVTVAEQVERMPEPESLSELGFLLEESAKLIDRARYP